MASFFAARVTEEYQGAGGGVRLDSGAEVIVLKIKVLYTCKQCGLTTSTAGKSDKLLHDRAADHLGAFDGDHHALGSPARPAYLL